MVQNNDNTTLYVRGMLPSKTNNETVSVNFCLLTASLLPSSLLIELSAYSAQYLVSTKNARPQQLTNTQKRHIFYAR